MTKHLQNKNRLLALLFALLMGTGTAWALDYSNLSLSDFTQMTSSTTAPSGDNYYNAVVTTTITGGSDQYCYYSFGNSDASMKWDFTPRCTGSWAMHWWNGSNWVSCQSTLFTNTNNGETVTDPNLHGVTVTYSNIGWIIEFPVEVHCTGRESNASYSTVYWGNLSHCPSEITAEVTPEGSGTVSGMGTYEFGSICSLTATANEDYMFIYWANETGQVVSNQAEYSFIVTGNRNLTAHFAEEGSICGITFNLNDSYGDGWNGNKLMVTYGDGNYEEVTLDSGSSGAQTLWIEHGSHVTLTWISGQYIAECSFTICYSNGNLIYNGSNLSSNFSYEFDVDCEEMPGVTFDITAVAYPEEGGTVSGAGEFHWHETCTLTATANEGYTFMYWTENGDIISHETEYSIIATSDRSLVANFALPFNISALASPAEYGAISGEGLYDYGNTCTLAATANEGYIFMYWTDNETGVVVSHQAEYSFVVTEGRNLTANFAEEGSICGITFNLNDSYGDGWNGNRLVVTYGDGNYEEVILENGISGAQTLWIEHGSHITLTWIEGYYIDECSFTVLYSNGNMIFYGSNLSSDFSYEFDVDCEEMPGITFDIMALANPEESGTVTGSGEFHWNETCTLTAIANEGYSFMYWTENGEVISNDAEYSFTVSSDRYLVANFVMGNVTSLTVYDGIATDERVPIVGWWTDLYTKCEYIMPASEVVAMNGSQIISMTCYNTQHYSVSYGSASFKVFMKEVDFTTIEDFQGYEDATIVYEGSLSVSSQGLLKILFTTPFEYHGGNLLIGVYNCVHGSMIGFNFFFGETAEGASIVGWDNESLDNIILDNDYSYDSDVQFPNFLPKTTFSYSEIASTSNITATANPYESGTIIGAGDYAWGDTCTLTATANEGYSFMYWTENGEEVSSDTTYSFTVTRDRRLVAHFILQGAATNSLNGLFSINENGGQVYFSRGNLQYQASTNTWRFAENQYDYVGNANSNISQTYSGWIDLFGWGTSGWNNGNTNYQPWHSTNAMNQWTHYGPLGLYNLIDDYANSDWGIFNAISNGGNQSNRWRTLSREEWDYIVNTRNTVSGIRFARGVVNGNSGLIILPDSWQSSVYELNNTNQMTADFTSNVISSSEWTDILQANGAVFLPCAGARAGTSMVFIDTRGSYWSSSYFDDSSQYSTFFDGQNCAYAIFFDNSILETNYNHRCDGLSVRLVSNVEYCNIQAVPNSTNGGSVSGSGYYIIGTECALTATANEGYIFKNWTINGEIVSTEPSYTFTVTASVNVTANFGIVCTQELVAGWNWWSTHLDITLDDLKAALVEALPGTTISINSQSNGNTTYDGSMWRGPLKALDVTQMYMINVTADCELTLEGMPINPTEHPVTIHPEFNWIAFPLSQSITLTNTFTGFIVNGDMVFSQDEGSSTYSNRWRGTLNTLKPGKGYIFLSATTSDRTFIFPTEN